MSVNLPPRPSFFSTPALVALAGMITLALYVLYPRISFFENLSSSSKPDALSIAYLEALIASDPENAAMRMSLARMYADTGQFKAAQQTLVALPLNEDSTLTHVEIAVRVMLGLWMAEMASDEQARLRHRFYEGLSLLSHHSERQLVSAALLEDFFAAAEPAITAQLLPEFLAGRPLHESLSLQQRLASAQAASGNPGAAADTLAGLLDSLPSVEQSRTRDTIINFYLGAGRPDRALHTFTRAGLPRREATSLHRGIELARLADNVAVEKRWLEALAATDAGDLISLRRLLDLQLADGQVARAQLTTERMQNRQAELTEADAIKIAQVFDWNNLPDRALVWWLRAYEMNPNQTTFERAKSLATALYQWDKLVTLLDLAARQRQLSPAEYLELADTHIHQGELDKASQVLQRALIQSPDNFALRNRLAELYFNDLQYPQAIATLEAATTLSETSSLLLANLYWRTRQPEKALEQLKNTRFSAVHQQDAELMKFNIAVALKDYEAVREEYRQTVTGDLRLLHDEFLERLLNLAYLFEEYEHVIRIGNVLLERSAEASLFSSVASIQASRLKWSELRHTLDSWQTALEHTETDVAFLIALAAYYQSEQRPLDALHLLRRALRLDPANADAKMALSWLKLSHPELVVGEFTVLLEKLTRNPETNRLGQFVAGYQALGNDRAAHHWRKQQALIVDEPLYRTPSRMRPAIDPTLSAYTPPPPRTRKALQAGIETTDVSQMTTQSRFLAGVYSSGRYSLQGKVADVGLSGDTRFAQDLQAASEASLSVSAVATRWQLDIGAGQKERLGSHDFWGQITLEHQLSSRWTLGVGHEEGSRALDSAEAWWLSGKNRTHLSARYSPMARVAISGSLADIAYDTASQTSLARGHEFNLQASYQVRYSQPAWLLEVGYSGQRLSQLSALDSATQALFEQPVDTDTVLAEDYRRISIGSRWQQGQVTGLDVPRTGISWFVDVRTGYVLSSSSMDFAISAGAATTVLGQDRLALSTGWRSDTLDGSASATLQATYTFYFSD